MTRGLIILAALAALPAEAQDVDAGRAIAEEFCARCHDIADGGAMKTYPPSFDSIAIFRAEEQIRARVIFPDLHTGMPQWGTFLDMGQVGDVTAYIMSLE
ncbi:c-type cytochrome [Antarctobacter jejuensis]|uniref:c-type cytochrome n=1 Tax=Antarctobacter jejuensis TaxID=1439938 RepID=UPI003FD39580